MLIALDATNVSGLGMATLVEATAINDAGIIVATGCLPGGPPPPPCVAYRLVPVADSQAGPANVPALSALALAALALCVAGAGIALRPR